VPFSMRSDGNAAPLRPIIASLRGFRLVAAGAIPF